MRGESQTVEIPALEFWYDARWKSNVWDSRVRILMWCEVKVKRWRFQR